MAWTAQDVARLKAAIAKGHQQVRIGDQQITYQSTSDMLAALKRMEAEVEAAAAAPRRPATSRYTFTTLRGH